MVVVDNEGKTMTLYATDGLCHNAEPGSYGHECSKPAVWIGTKPSGFQSGYCAACKVQGYEARGVVQWRKLEAKGA